jgi:hypothetical protein
MSSRIRLSLPQADQARYDELVERATAEAWAERLFARDTSLWTTDPDRRRGHHGPTRLARRAGPLRASSPPALEGFGDGAREAGFDTAVVMGMGGSSLAPDILHRTFGTTEGYLGLRILDSTDPAAVAATVDDLDPLETLWIVASKSGTTTEPLAFMADAWARVEAQLKARDADDQQPGEFFAVITDPGKSLAAIPHQDDLRERFLNPPDVGGRYSALTYVGLVPASLIGLDLDALLVAAATMLDACREPEASLNPGLQLGLAMGGLARAGRDKLTLLADPPIESFGAWAEQLIAESTGKHGVGIVPVDQEPARAVADYGTIASSSTSASPGASVPTEASRRARRRWPAGHPDRARRPDRPRRRSDALGGRDGLRGRRPGDQPIRPAERRGGQGADPQGARRRLERARQRAGERRARLTARRARSWSRPTTRTPSRTSFGRRSTA